MNPRLVPRFFRTIAILIAIAGVIDPAMTSTRRTRPEIAVVAGGASGDEALARRVANTLDGKFTVIAAPFAGAAGTVLVGNSLPTSATELPPPVFAVVPERDGATVTFERVNGPLRAPLEARIGISVSTRTTGARGRRLEVSLHSGELVVDRVTLDVAGDDDRHETELAFVPTAVGAVPLRITAGVVGTGEAATTAAVDLAIDIREQRWSVLFFDPRPSWQSTFVRRAVERDPRFVVTSRVVTSRSLSTDAGRPPGTLDDFTTMSLFDAIVVGAPDALGDRDVAGLDAYLRRRGGTVVLLLDQRGAGPFQRLTGAREWMGSSSSAGFSVLPVGGDSVGLRASEIAWPRVIPAGARELARSRFIGSDSGVSHPVLWRSAVGAGQLIVSGALDAWRYRDPAVSAFDAFWRTTVGTAADAALPPVSISLGNSVLGPYERTEISVTLRDASLAPVASNRAVRASVAALLETPGGAVSIRLWPTAPVGTFRGSFRAPAAPGTYRVVVTGDGSRADAPIIVAPSILRPVADDSDLVAAWAGSHGGSSISSTLLEELAPALERAVRPVPRRETWYPLRSQWLIIPFSLALGMEWLWRRKRGLA
jgi:hypothetical protein